MSRKNASRKSFHYIYQTTCRVTGRYYIGMHSTDKRHMIDDAYMGSGQRLKRSIKKHGLENHTLVILEDCSERGREFLRCREKAWVNEERLKDDLCMNMCLGGAEDATHFKTISDTHRIAISQASTGRKHSEASKLKMSLVKKARIANRGGFTEEHRMKLSEAHMGQTSPMKGKKFSKQHRARLSEGQKRRFARSRANDDASALG